MKILKIFLITSLLIGFSITKANACACGCGVFNVGTSSLIPSCAGGTAFVQYDYINQNQNWNNNDKAAAENPAPISTPFTALIDINAVAKSASSLP